MEFKRSTNMPKTSKNINIMLGIKPEVMAVQNAEETPINTTLKDLVKKSEKNIKVEYFPLPHGEIMNGVLGRVNITFYNSITIRNILLRKTGQRSFRYQMPQVRMENGSLEDIITISKELDEEITFEILNAI